MSRIWLGLPLAVVVLTGSANAQEVNGTAIGLGVTLNPTAIADFDMEASLLPLGFGNFTVPIRLGERFRLEPELGILRTHSEFSGGGFEGEFSSSVLRYGVAAHYFLAGADFRPYVGPRIGFIRQSNRQEVTGSPVDEESRTDSYLGVAIGGEYWLNARFSLGAEVQINRVGIGDEDDAPPGGDSSSSFLSNNGVISVRFYL